MADDRGRTAQPSKLANYHQKAARVALLLFGLLWLVVSAANLVADAHRWGYYLMFLLGMLAIIAAFHPLTRTPLSWPLPVLDPDEQVLMQERASWVAGLARGGTIVVTTRSLIFEPNSMELELGQRTRTWEWSTVRAVEVAPRGLNLAGGAVRRRLRLVLSDGSAELFVVHSPDELKKRLTSLIART